MKPKNELIYVGVCDGCNTPIMQEGPFRWVPFFECQCGDPGVVKLVEPSLEAALLDRIGPYRFDRRSGHVEMASGRPVVLPPGIRPTTSMHMKAAGGAS